MKDECVDDEQDVPHKANNPGVQINVLLNPIYIQLFSNTKMSRCIPLKQPLQPCAIGSQ